MLLGQLWLWSPLWGLYCVPQCGLASLAGEGRLQVGVPSQAIWGAGSVCVLLSPLC